MIPQTNALRIGQDVKLAERRDQPSKTYHIDFEAGRVMGYVDGIEAVKQAIAKIVLSERFLYRIYSWNYGAELNRMLGKSRAVFESEIKRILQEALLEDRRITEVRDVVVSWTGKREVLVTYRTITVFGETSQEVMVNV